MRKSILPKAVASRQKSRENQSFIEEEYNQSQSNNESDTFFDFDNPSTYENEYNLNDKQNKVEKDALNNLLERLERNQPEKCVNTNISIIFMKISSNFLLNLLGIFEKNEITISIGIKYK